MKTFMKKFLTCITLSALCLTTIIAPSTASAASLGSRVEVDINGTLLDVTITPALVVAINPNNGAVTPTGTLNVSNNSVAPIKVTLTGITPVSGGPSGYALFNLVSPDKYPDWSKLNKTQSQDLALKLTAGSGWKVAPTDYRSGTSDTLVGTLNPSSTGIISVGTVYHGNSFAATTSTAFDFAFAVELE